MAYPVGKQQVPMQPDYLPPNMGLAKNPCMWKMARPDNAALAYLSPNPGKGTSNSLSAYQTEPVENFVFKPNKQYRLELLGPKHILNPDGSFSSIRNSHISAQRNLEAERSKREMFDPELIAQLSWLRLQFQAFAPASFMHLKKLCWLSWCP